MLISSIAIKLDKGCSFVPVLSSITGAVNLVAKAILFKNHSLLGNEYSSYLAGKSWKQCAIQCIPIAGNVYMLFLSLARPEQTASPLDYPTPSLSQEQEMESPLDYPTPSLSQEQEMESPLDYPTPSLPQEQEMESPLDYPTPSLPQEQEMESPLDYPTPSLPQEQEMASPLDYPTPSLQQQATTLDASPISIPKANPITFTQEEEPHCPIIEGGDTAVIEQSPPIQLPNDRPLTEDQNRRRVRATNAIFLAGPFNLPRLKRVKKPKRANFFSRLNLSGKRKTVAYKIPPKAPKNKVLPNGRTKCQQARNLSKIKLGYRQPNCAGRGDCAGVAGVLATSWAPPQSHHSGGGIK